MFRFRFLGKTKIPHRKNTAHMAPVRMPAPKTVCITMDQHLGAPATPVVKVGDEVKVGQLIAEAAGVVSAPIHASVSGKVTKIDSYLRASGALTTAVWIESDGLMTPCEGITPPSITDLGSLIDAIRACGLVGLGGAGFPTAVKFEAIRNGAVNTIILNGAECEPYLTSDARTMLDHSDLMREGVALLQRVLPCIEHYIIGIEKNKPDCIAEMKRVFEGDDSVSIAKLPTRYPQGAEKILIRNTTGLTVPEGKLPADVGVIVMNVTTLATLAKYAKTGMPLVEKCVTVDGSGVNEPKNVIAPIGSSVADIIAFAGGFREEIGKIILGGPMTGRAVYSTDEPIAKTTGAVLAFAPKDAKQPEITHCLHCGKCIDTCPNNLNVPAFALALKLDSKDDQIKVLEDSRVNLCIECGSCAYVCPANRPLTEGIRIAKTALRENKAHKATLK
ncbi:MAG: electron transport complex subunit RsxC [Clostridia bacterium]|nr:electron transport complex subunit RsxC [Clostridia bacterium]